MKITGQIEQIFAHAVALDQSGGLKNSIYIEENLVHVMNYDHTVLLQFKLRSTEQPFEETLSFNANDYDSNEFFQEDGKIVFLSTVQGYERKKVCGLAEYKPKEVRKMMRGYLKKDFQKEPIILDKSILELLDDSLSHIEFSGKRGETLKMIQRNIYSGGIIEISEKTKGLFDNKLKNDFGPVGIKTKDFAALFTFQNTLKFEFPSGKNKDFIIIHSLDKHKRDMSGIIACCLYDELINIQKLK